MPRPLGNPVAELVEATWQKLRTDQLASPFIFYNRVSLEKFLLKGVDHVHGHGLQIV